MTALTAINDRNFDRRIDAFDALLKESQRYQPGQAPAEYINRLKTAAQTVQRQLETDQAISGATCRGVFSKTCTDTKGRTTWVDGSKLTTGDVDAAKKMVPADGMFTATLQALLERYGNEPGRWLGKRSETWDREIKAHLTAAERAFAALQGGDVAAAAELTASLSGLAETMKALEAEAANEPRTIAGQKSAVEGFRRVAEADGISTSPAERKRKEVLAAAGATVDSLNQEVNAERALVSNKAAVVRPFVVGQLQHDPAFADRGFNDMTTKTQAWNGVIAAANDTSSKARELAGSVGVYHQALNTAASAPSQIGSLEAALSQARANLDAALSALQSARIQHSSQERRIALELNSAVYSANMARRNVREADDAVDSWRRSANEAEARVNNWAREIARLERLLREAEQSGSGLPGGGGQSGSGGLGDPSPRQRPGGQSGSGGLGGGGQSGSGGLGGGQGPGSGLPGGGSTPDPKPELRRQLREAEANHSRAVVDLRRARQGYNEAVQVYDSRRQQLHAAENNVRYWEGERHSNDAWLQQHESAASQADAYHDRIASDLASTRRGLEAARQTIAVAEPTIGGDVDAFNGSLQALDRSIGTAQIGPEGQASLRNIPLAPVSKGEVTAQVRRKEDGITALGQMSATVTQGAGSRAQTASSTKAGLDARIEQTIQTEVQKTLR